MKSQSYISNLIELVVAFAIFWLVIGDLITYHQEQIFGNYLFDAQCPFNLPKGKDDGKTATYKSWKGTDDSIHPGICLPAFATTEKPVNCIIKQKPTKIRWACAPNYLTSVHYGQLSSRPPPTALA